MRPEEDFADVVLDFELLLLVQGYSLLHAAVARPDILQNRLCLEEQALGITIHKPLAELEVSNDELSRVAESCSDHEQPQHSPSAATPECHH